MGSFLSRHSPVSHDSPPPYPDSLPTSQAYAPSSQSPVPVVLCYAYLGTGYYGLQFASGLRTIESDLFDAITSSNTIPPLTIRNKSVTKWTQASRTDKGVHCCSQVLSFQCRLPTGVSVRDLPELLSRHLPPDSSVRFWGALSLGSRFNSQRLAEARRYAYLLPFSIIGESAFDFVKNEVMPQFVGQHNFHNYTKHVSPTNPGVMRTIHEFSISEPFVINQRTFVLCKIHGNSFMLNQIRKMIGTVVAIVHGVLQFEQLQATFTTECFPLPLFPGEGLFLDHIEYTGFLRAQNRGETVPPSRDIEFTTYRPQIENWKQNVMFPHIADLVTREKTFENWLESIIARRTVLEREEEEEIPET